MSRLVLTGRVEYLPPAPPNYTYVGGRTEIRDPELGVLQDWLSEMNPPSFVMLPLDLYIEISLLGTKKGARTASIVQTNENGQFTWAMDFGDLEGLAPVAAFWATATAYLPFNRQVPFKVRGLITGEEGQGSRDERIFAAAQAAITNIRLPVNTSDMRRSRLEIVPMPQEELSHPFQDITDVTVELRRPNSGELFGIAPAPGDADQRAINLVHVARLPEFYLRIRTGVVTETLDAVTLARSRLQPARRGALASQRPVLIRVPQEVGIGTISDGVPEEAALPGVPVVMRNVDLDFVPAGEGENRVLRIRADIGIGWGEEDGTVSQLSGLGQYTGQFSLTARSDPLGPFSDAEIDDLVQIANLTSRYDLLPDTDVDELIPGGFLGLETALADFVSSEIQPRITANFARRIREAMDDRRAEVEERDHPPGLDWGSIVGHVFETMFLQPEPLEVTADRVRLVARVGFWSDELDVFTSDCPFDALALMAPRTAIRPAGHAIQRFLKREGLGDLLELFEKHRGELRRLMFDDPKTAREFALLLVRTHGAILGRRPGLTTEEVAQIRSLGERWLPNVNANLRARLAPLAEALGSLAGVGDEELKRRLFRRRDGKLDSGGTPGGASDQLR